MENKYNVEKPESEFKESLTPGELMKRHLFDRKHIITDEEMENLKVGKEAEENKELQKEIKDKVEEDDLDHRHENNAFDILDA
jgi:hypothetical protein